MNWVIFQTKSEYNLSPFPSLIPPNNSNPSENDISPSILLIVVVLAVIFFISGLLHLLVRFFYRPSDRDPDDFFNATARQGQLQQLFELHDAGVDQSFLDSLPVFLYKAIIRLKNPFDCAICLCEFKADDKLRLLPKCSHAFHLVCIDTWLLSHSTCPLCRVSLLPEFSSSGRSSNYSTVVPVLESAGCESSREIGSGIDVGRESPNEGTQLSFLGDGDVGGKTEEEARFMPVKLGKFRNADVAVEGGECSNSSNCNLDGRRCFSMGSFEYVLDESSVLQVAIRSPVRKHSKKPSLPLTPGHRAAMSECDCLSSRDVFEGFNAGKGVEIHGDCSVSANATDIGKGKGESFSISKIWLRSKKDKSFVEDSSRRAFSFRLPLQRAAADEMKLKRIGGRRTVSEIDVGWLGRGRGELGLNFGGGSCNGLESLANPPSFGRRTLLWLVGRQNKVVHSSSAAHA
ncbi:RING-H2 finger protein ATL13-like [Magnolia sinica]|uniref:RING-H2 finger protein ATL13-like n=1 Tax=Magnolia sinica TaxID=86752 RepID=UPI002657C6C5|nr:RING-H2 finger protein ATL13-like [Magnolia sinica]